MWEDCGCEGVEHLCLVCRRRGDECTEVERGSNEG